MECKMSEQSAIVLAAGTAITMACIKRIMVMLFAEQWRTKVFLVLNLVLLAIFFTSVRSSSRKEQVKVGKMKRRKLQSWTDNGLSESGDDSYKNKRANGENLIKGFLCGVNKRSDQVEQQSGVDESSNKLSKEELNERAEAFIAMFRQHLALDGRQGNIIN